MRKFLVSVSVSLLLASTTGLSAAPAPPQPNPAVAPAAAAAAPTAPSAERLELARRFVALGNQNDNYMELLRMGFWSSASPYLETIDDERERETATAQAEGLMTTLEPAIRKRLPAVTEAYARAYAAKFSADELRELIVFASTATGKRYLSSIAAFDSDPGVTEAASAMAEELYPAIMEFQKKACADRAQQRIAMGDKKATCPLSADPQVRSL